MTPAEIARALGAAAAIPSPSASAAAIEQGSLDAGYARMLERLSDKRLGAKDYPDGRYVPPEG